MLYKGVEMTISVKRYDPHKALIQKLVSALFLENYGDFRSHSFINNHYLKVSLNKTNSLLFNCIEHKGQMVPFKVVGNEILLQSEAHPATAIELDSLMSHFISADWWPNSDSLRIISKWQEVLSTVNILAQPAPVQSHAELLEWFAIVVDRPNHPFAHAKASLQDILTHWHGQNIHWWAFPKARVFTRNDEDTVQTLLGQYDAAAINHKLAELQGDYIALPLLPSQTACALKIEDAHDLCLVTQLGYATSSLRTFFHQDDPSVHIKLASIATPLGAMRTMPPRYLYNGDCAFQLLQQIVSRSTFLSDRVVLCDEQAWWSLGENADMLQCKGEIGFQIRRFPKSGKKFMLSMAALNHPESWHIIEQEGICRTTLLKNVCRYFVKMGLEFLYFGVAPECHGQNVSIAINSEDDFVFVLRDHDSLRICPDQLAVHQLTLPDYQINWQTPNTLVLPNLTELSKYFITLGLQVNLYALSQAFSPYEKESQFWQQLSEDIQEALSELNNAAFSNWAESNFIKQPSWPFKEILAPLFSASDDVTGMPSSMATIANPLYELNTVKPEQSCEAH